MLPAILVAAVLSSTTSPSDVTATAPRVPSFRGYSGALRVVYAERGEKLHDPFDSEAVRQVIDKARWRSHRGGLHAVARELTAPRSPGIWSLEADAAKLADVAVITRVPISKRRRGVLNGYRMGFWPAERSGGAGTYAPPSAFIEVTPQNQDFHVSEHFQLRQFLTKDQKRVWPKYLALDLRLVDKLELVIQELNAMGHPTSRLHVMSGFRTPRYNGPGERGRAKFSRHTYGDAADVWVDEDHDGQMDDLNGDGRIDIDDAEVVVRAVERVEAKYPDLRGGAGVYRANRAHGPFVHIDTRGTEARWSKR